MYLEKKPPNFGTPFLRVIEGVPPFKGGVEERDGGFFLNSIKTWH